MCFDSCPSRWWSPGASGLCWYSEDFSLAKNRCVSKTHPSIVPSRKPSQVTRLISLKPALKFRNLASSPAHTWFVFLPVCMCVCLCVSICRGNVHRTQQCYRGRWYAVRFSLCCHARTATGGTQDSALCQRLRRSWYQVCFLISTSSLYKSVKLCK